MPLFASTSADDGKRLQLSLVPACLFCGEPEHVEIAEVWSYHTFVFQTCCESFHDLVCREMADDPVWARTLLQRLDVETLAGHRLRRLADDGGCGLLLDWQLAQRPVEFRVAHNFVGRHHRHCVPPVAWRFGRSVFNGGTMIGVVMVGNPVARAFGGRGILEVNRLCIRRDIPRVLAWNAASILYGWSASEARRLGWSRIITYTRIDEDGVSLRAAGWTKEAQVRGRGWHSAGRSRSNSNSLVDKVRWGKPSALFEPGKKRSPIMRARLILTIACCLGCSWTADAGQLVLQCEVVFDLTGHQHHDTITLDKDHGVVRDDGVEWSNAMATPGASNLEQWVHVDDDVVTWGSKTHDANRPTSVFQLDLGTGRYTATSTTNGRFSHGLCSGSGPTS